MEIMSARDLARYLKINEKKIYKLVQESKIPNLKIGGKIAFTRELIDRWILEGTEHEHHIHVAGSDDPLVREILDTFNATYSTKAFYAPVGSLNGLKLLREGGATMSCVHILDVDRKEYNLSYLDRYLDREEYAVLLLFFREQGLYLPKGNPAGIHGLRDAAEKKVSFLLRNQGSGTRLLFDFLLQREGIDPRRIRTQPGEAESHLQAGLQVLSGNDECSFGIKHVAALLGLEFISLWKERFDMVVPRSHLSSGPARDLLSFFNQPALLRDMGRFSGYDISQIGQTLHPHG